MTSLEQAAYRARTRRAGMVLALIGAALTVLAVAYKPPLVGLAALVVVLGGAFWVGRRHLIVRFSRDGAPPTSR